jgi:prenylcysteine oxidase / farnesylcysteine lyase
VDYRAVIIAAPFHSTGINTPSWISSIIPKQPYVHLHVTFVSTNSTSLRPEYLNLSPSTSKTPDMLLTTFDGARHGGKQPEFNSVSYHGKITEDEWIVKIFSKQRISDEWLGKVFKHVGWVHRHEVFIRTLLQAVS